ncbi:Na+/H+ antiporter [Klebsormidium nitens]|uniref:Na+/H+ antiporter n=1 Tax=Klebsormidium nitens TaxID=105231 RepID=A0A1Y1IEM8_KLENI|nr:Na+/H+ antiporter [Klebsormidium nitens]|eukprot:GAQ86568.1 Na+/H+ antiporter [Klebsormidium nitens]
MDTTSTHPWALQLSSPLQFLTLKTEEGGVKPEIAILFFGLALILGALCKQVSAHTLVPYTVALLIIGIVLGVLDHVLHNGLGTLGESIQIWADIEPGLILFVFLPALLFESSMSMEVHKSG